MSYETKHGNIYMHIYKQCVINVYSIQGGNSTYGVQPCKVIGTDNCSAQYLAIKKGFRSCD
jgi:hypothetical protein